MGEEVVLDPGFAVWVRDVVVANVCASGLGGFRYRVDSEKADGPTLVLEDIERRGRFAIGFLDIKKVRSGHCLLDRAFEVGAIDPNPVFRYGNGEYMVSHSPVEVKHDRASHGREGREWGKLGEKTTEGLGTRPPIHEINKCVGQYGPYSNREWVIVT